MSEHTSHESPSDETSRLGHEPDFVYARGIQLAAVGFVALVVLALLAMYATLSTLQRIYAPKAPSMSQVRPERTTAGPLVVENQVQQLQELRRSEERVLQSYAWVDKERGTVRIPIERAMAIVAERGLSSVQPAIDEPSSQQSQGDSPQSRSAQNAEPTNQAPLTEGPSNDARSSDPPSSERSENREEAEQ